ncbi:MAG: hypothetical protein HYY06_18900 [Deltaproteobacteria bacterium]|nr:hypothetical protein [Deltaproteobacteria bacterium]
MVVASCSDPASLGLDRKATREAARVERFVREYLDRTAAALARHAGPLAAALEEPEGDPRRRAAYPLIRKLRSPTASRGEADFDLQTAGLVFLAVLDGEGKFVVRDEGPEKMYREDLRPRFACVREALAGRRAYSTGLVPGNDYAVVVAAVPIQKDGRTLGAFIGVASYPSLARRVERQGSYEAHATDGGLPHAATVRVALYWKDKYYSGSVQPELDAFRPKAARRRARLGESGRYAETILVQERPFGMAVRRVDFLGEDAGFVLWRAEPFSD